MHVLNFVKVLFLFTIDSASGSLLIFSSHCGSVELTSPFSLTIVLVLFLFASYLCWYSLSTFDFLLMLHETRYLCSL